MMIKPKPIPNRSQDHVLLEKTVLCISRILDHFSNNIIIMKFWLKLFAVIWVLFRFKLKWILFFIHLKKLVEWSRKNHWCLIIKLMKNLMQWLSKKDWNVSNEMRSRNVFYSKQLFVVDDFLCKNCFFVFDVCLVLSLLSNHMYML
jgi:hypothetical protein